MCIRDRYRTVQEWELGHREMPGYLLRLMYYHEKTKEKEKLLPKMQSEDGKISIVRDADGKNIVIINDIRFRGKRKMSWKEVEEFLKEYVKTYYEIEAYSEKIYIGTDFPGEYAHSCLLYTSHISLTCAHSLLFILYLSRL